MIFSLTMISIVVTLAFITLSFRFDRSIKKMPLKKLTSKPLISVLIPAYNSENSIRKTLKSVRDSSYENIEIIVVNDSLDSTPAIAKEFGARVIQNKKRGGKGPALNIAASIANGEYFLVLDSDTTMQKNTLSTLMKSFHYYASKGEKVGIVAPSYKAKDNKNMFSRFTNLEQSMHQQLFKIQMNLGSIISIRGCCLLMTKKVFCDAGGFSKTILEDGDFTAKVFKAGYKIKYEPRAVVKTQEPSTVRELLDSKLRYGKGTFFCAFKHRRPYIFSLQSFICFYPHFLLSLAMTGYFLLGNPLSLYPLTIFSASIIFQGNSLILFLALITSLPLIGTTGQALLVVERISTINSTILVSMILFPIVTYAYFKGLFSGISDKYNKRAELDFGCW